MNLPLCSTTFILFLFCTLAAEANEKFITHEIQTPATHLRVKETDLDMTGQLTRHTLQLGTPNEPAGKLLWVTGYEVVTDSNQQKRDDLLCHSYLRVGTAKSRKQAVQDYKTGFKNRTLMGSKIFTLGEGQNTIHFPDGFGIPVLAGQTLTTETMGKGPAEYLKQKEADLSFAEKIFYISDVETKVPMRPLSRIGIQTSVPAEKTDHADESCHKPEWVDNQEAVATEKDTKGTVRLLHWMVPPGKHIYRSEAPITNDLRVHMITVHVHPFAESVELFDKTTKRSLFKSQIETAPHGRLVKVPQYVGEEGLQMFKNHQYELIATYNNTSKAEVDAMATVQLYFLDSQFQR